RAMRVSRAQWRRSLATRPPVLSILVVLLGLSVSSVFPQSQPPITPVPNSPDRPGDLPDLIVKTHDQVNLRNASKAAGEPGKTTFENETTCLLPPLSGMSSPTVAVQQLQRAARARNEYQQGCAALRKKKRGDAEKHFRKAVREYPKYGTAWVTLG